VKRITNVEIGKESFEDMHKAGRWNPSLEITFRDRGGSHTYKISAGYADEIHVYREAGITYVLARNTHLPYMGVEAFEGDEVVGDIYLQEGQVEEVLGRSDLAPATIVRRLRDYLIQ